MKHKRFVIIPVLVLILLMIPWVAMQFSVEVNWSLFDFLIMGILLLSTGFLIEFVWRKIKSTKNRIIICTAVLLIFALIWAELAVGIFGTPLAGS